MAEPASKSRTGLPPIPRTRLIGRENEQAMARALLLEETVPLLTLTGPGGVGKTRLALAVAADVADRFTDGVVWINLAPLVDPALVPTTVAQALELTPAAAVPVQETLEQHLYYRQALLLFDNCEHVLTATAELIVRLLTACRSVQVLATSRAPLRLQAEQVLPVEPLLLPTSDYPDVAALAQIEAVQLFIERARALRPTFRLDASNALSVAAICRHLDGLPLAIELAAARTTLLSPGALLAQMHDRLRLLRGGARDAPVRQQTMREAIAWSYDLLTPAQQKLFRRLAVFVGGFAADAAEAVAGPIDSEDDILDQLGVLVEASLVRAEIGAGEPRFGMFETIREYALERLMACDEAAVRGRHAAWYLALAADLKPGVPFSNDLQRIARLDAEHENLRAALTWFELRGEAELLAQLAGNLAWFWLGGRHKREGRRWLERSLGASAGVSFPSRLCALAGAGHIANQQGDHERATEFGEELLSLATQQEDRATEAEAMMVLSRAANQRGASTEAATFARRAIAIYREQEDQQWLPWALQRLGVELHTAGEYASAAAVFDEAREAFRVVPNLLGTAFVLSNLGQVWHALGNRRQATTLYSECLALPKNVTAPWETANLLGQIAAVAAEVGRVERSARLLGAADELYQITGTTPHPYIRDMNERTEAEARIRLGAEAFVAAWEFGKGLSFEQTIEEARAAVDTVYASLDPAQSSVEAGPSLTPRERDILRLLVARRSNSEIAQMLFISRRTASTHVSNILGKLGVRSRTEAADYAHRHHLI